LDSGPNKKAQLGFLSLRAVKNVWTQTEGLKKVGKIATNVIPMGRICSTQGRYLKQYKHLVRGDMV
jgi:hypothetical protein